MKTVHINPTNNTVNAVTHTDATFHVYPDGSFDLDMNVNGEVVFFRFNSKVGAKDIAELHAVLFATTPEERGA
jgi:hypothetical protein